MNFIVVLLIILIQLISQPFFGAFLFSDKPQTANADKNNDGYILAQSLNPLPLIDDLFLQSREETILPIRNWTIDELNLNAKSALAIFINLRTGQDKILYQNNRFEKIPIASLTKIMTAIIAVENANPNDIVKVSKRAVLAEGAMGGLRVDEEISVENLLKAMLISSSNDAAVALDDYFFSKFAENLIELMNAKSKKIGLENTNFSTPNGLDDTNNYSTAADLFKLVKYALRYDKIWEITRIVSIDIHASGGKINHHLANTNQLLNKVEDIYGGKTGYTEAAKESMVLIQKLNNNDNNFIVYVLLGSADRFGEMLKLARWTKNAYIFKF